MNVCEKFDHSIFITPNPTPRTIIEVDVRRVVAVIEILSNVPKPCGINEGVSDLLSTEITRNFLWSRQHHERSEQLLTTLYHKSSTRKDLLMSSIASSPYNNRLAWNLTSSIRQVDSVLYT